MVQVTRPELVWKTAIVQPGASAEVIDIRAARYLMEPKVLFGYAVRGW